MPGLFATTIAEKNKCVMPKIGVISDTHSYLDPKVFEHFADCDEIWHGGDIGKKKVSDDLENFKPLRGCYGNIDGQEIRAIHPLNNRFEVDGMKVLITHICGKPGRYTARVKELIKEEPPDILICGHSHILRVMWDKDFNHLHINPGAMGRVGYHKVRTMITFHIEAGKPKDLKVIEFPR